MSELKPITREEMYLAAAAGQDVTVPDPITRKEMFLAKLVDKDAATPFAITRTETFLKAAAEARNASVIVPLEITENGTYEAPAGVDGYNPITVAVDPTKITILREQEFTGFVLDESFGAYSNGFITPAPFVLVSGEKYHVVWDGEEVECTAYSFDNYGVPMVAIGNGSQMGLPGNNEKFLIGYTAAADAVQFFSMDTNDSHTLGIWQEVKQSGGGSLPAGLYVNSRDYYPPSQYYQRWFVYNSELYVLALASSIPGNAYNLYKYVNGAWSTITSNGNFPALSTPVTWGYIEYNGKIHMFGSGNKYHVVFDGTSFTRLNDVPNYVYGSRVWFIQDNTIKVRSSEDGTVYAWDKSSDTWIAEATIGGTSSIYFYNCGGTVYFVYNGMLCKYENKSAVEIREYPGTIYDKGEVFNNCIYYFSSIKAIANKQYGSYWYKYDPEKGIKTDLGTLPHAGDYAYIVELEKKLYYQGGIPSASYAYINNLYEVTE